MKEREIKNLVTALLFKEDLVEYPYRVHRKKYDMYKEALIICEELHKKCLISYEADALDKPYENHAVFLTLNIQEDNYLEFSPEDAKLFLNLIGCFEGFLVDYSGKEVSITLSMDIYKSAE